MSKVPVVAAALVCVTFASFALHYYYRKKRLRSLGEQLDEIAELVLVELDRAATKSLLALAQVPANQRAIFLHPMLPQLVAVVHHDDVMLCLLDNDLNCSEALDRFPGSMFNTDLLTCKLLSNANNVQKLCSNGHLTNLLNKAQCDLAIAKLTHWLNQGVTFSCSPELLLALLNYDTPTSVSLLAALCKRAPQQCFNVELVSALIVKCNNNAAGKEAYFQPLLEFCCCPEIASEVYAAAGNFILNVCRYDQLECAYFALAMLCNDKQCAESLLEMKDSVQILINGMRLPLGASCIALHSLASYQPRKLFMQSHPQLTNALLVGNHNNTKRLQVLLALASCKENRHAMFHCNGLMPMLLLKDDASLLLRWEVICELAKCPQTIPLLFAYSGLMQSLVANINSADDDALTICLLKTLANLCQPGNERRIFLFKGLVKRLLDILQQGDDATMDKAAFILFRLACRRVNKREMIAYPQLIDTLVNVAQRTGASKYSSRFARSALVALRLLREDNSVMQDFAMLENDVLQFWKSVLLVWTVRSTQQVKRFYDTSIKRLPVEMIHLLLCLLQ